jgi:hypothetical protein
MPNVDFQISVDRISSIAQAPIYFCLFGISKQEPCIIGISSLPAMLFLVESFGNKDQNTLLCFGSA